MIVKVEPVVLKVGKDFPGWSACINDLESLSPLDAGVMSIFRALKFGANQAALRVEGVDVEGVYMVSGDNSDGCVALTVRKMKDVAA